MQSIAVRFPDEGCDEHDGHGDHRGEKYAAAEHSGL